MVNNPGYMDEVHDLRDRYGADLVALFVARPASRVCGVAWTPNFGRNRTHDYESWGFSVTARSCERADFRTFAHEIGHNQGALHDPYNSQRTCPSGPDSCIDDGNFPWRYGRCNTEQGWRTVMAYFSRQYGGTGACRQATARFSSPNVTWQGSATGDAALRDNRRVLLATAQRVANYRQSVVEPPQTHTHTLPLVRPAGTGQESLVRFVNRSATSGTVRITAFDDTGRRFGPVFLTLGASRDANITSGDLERGNAAKGLPVGVGNGSGSWRLDLSTALTIDALAYIRNPDGSLMSMHDTAPESGGSHWAHESPHLRHQMTPKISRYTRCSISICENFSTNGRSRCSGQFGMCSYSINPWRNSECVRRFTVFAFNHRSYPKRSPAAPNNVNNAIDNALSNNRRSRRSTRLIRIDDNPIPNRMSLMSRKLVSIPQRLP